MAALNSIISWRLLIVFSTNRLLRFLNCFLAASPSWFSLSGIKRLYLAAISYILVRWLYTDRIDLMVGAPPAAVVGPLTKGPPETQAVFMCLSLVCAVTLLVSYGFLSLLKLADLLPARLLHYTRVLCCTHLLLQRQSPRKEEPHAVLGAPQRDSEATRGCLTPSSTGSQEHEACIFCFEELKTGDLLRVVTACGHKFHAACIDVWLFERLKASCPMCGRLRYPNGEGPLWALS